MEKIISLNSSEGLSLWLENNRISYENELFMANNSDNKNIIPLELRDQFVLDVFRAFGTHPDVYVTPAPAFYLEGNRAVSTMQCGSTRYGSTVLKNIQESLDKNRIVCLYQLNFTPNIKTPFDFELGGTAGYGILLRFNQKEKNICCHCCCHGKNK